MGIEILSMIILVLFGVIIYLIRTSSNSYIDFLFSKKIEGYKNELEKTTLEFQTKQNYNLNVTNDSYKATLDAYYKIFDAYKSYWKSLSTTLKPGESDSGYQELKQIETEIKKKLILMDKEIYEKIIILLGDMAEVILNRSQGISININTIKEMNSLTNDEIPNLIRKKFGLDTIPNQLLGIDSNPPAV